MAFVFNKIDTLKIALNNTRIDILTSSGTWFKMAHDDQQYNIKNYNLIRHVRNFGTGTRSKKGGGLCIYHNIHLPVDGDTLKHLNTSSPDIESQWVIAKPNNTKPILIANIYRPPTGNTHTFIQTLQDKLSLIDHIHRYELVILGDFNIDLNANSTNTTAAKELQSWAKLYNLEQHVQSPTRVNANTRTTIDLIFTNINHITSAGVIDTNISDHQPVYIIKKKHRHTKKRKQVWGEPTNNIQKTYSYKTSATLTQLS